MIVPRPFDPWDKGTGFEIKSASFGTVHSEDAIDARSAMPGAESVNTTPMTTNRLKSFMVPDCLSQR